MEIKLPGTPNIAQDKHAGAAGREESRVRKNERTGLVGLVNIGNSCYMNATLQALSNCPPFRQYFIDILHSSSLSSPPQPLSMGLSVLFKRMWSTDSYPGHMSPRNISSAMKQRMFKGSQQQDAQEFLRCLLSQIHDEVSIQVPPAHEGRGSHCSSGQHRDSMASCDSDTSADSNSSQSRLVGNSPMFSKKKSGSSSSLPESQNSPTTTQPKYNRYIKINSVVSQDSNESLQPESSDSAGDKRLGSDVDTSQSNSEAELGLEWSDSDVFVADLVTRKITVHRNYLRKEEEEDCLSGDSENNATQDTTLSSAISDDTREESRTEEGDDDDGTEEGEGGEDWTVKVQNGATRAEEKAVKEEQAGVQRVQERQPASEAQSPVPSTGTTTSKQTKTPASVPRKSSIVSQVFEGTLESRVKCLACKVVSVTREPFQDLSLPIPGRKELEKVVSKEEEATGQSSEESTQPQDGFSQKMCSIWNVFKSFFLEPPTNIYDCLHAFFDTSELKGDNRYYCSNCKSFQNSQKEMSIVDLPEVLCVHLKRFRFDVYFPSKISRHISFPLTKLDMTRYLKKHDQSSPTCTYDLNAIITHYGGAGGGHYVTFAKNSLCNDWFEFNDSRVAQVPADSIPAMEGYVLFYRRVPPNYSASLQSVNITSLLPPSGTTLPSPDVCYISRHWLHLLKHLAYPGPITQYDFACQHGAVLPTLRRDEAHLLALGIRRSIWETYQRQHKGGPFVQQLEVCQECKDSLDQLNERRKVEKDHIHKVQLDKKSVPKVEHFILPVSWIRKWQQFIACSSFDVQPPGPIDNTALIQLLEHSDSAHSYKLFDGATHRKVSQAAWQFFHQTYGGGPVLVSTIKALQTEVV